MYLISCICFMKCSKDQNVVLLNKKKKMLLSRRYVKDISKTMSFFEKKYFSLHLQLRTNIKPQHRMSNK